MIKPKIIAIIGPTASGKTALSTEIAEIISERTGKTVEIISADSRQVYRHIPISTAQPSPDILNKFKHHFVSELELDEEFNAGEFGKKGRKIIERILRAGKIPLIVGGSGLYIDSLTEGLFDYAELKDEKEFSENQKKVRAKLYLELHAHGLDKLVSELKKVDPVTINSMSPVTDRRVIRALEVYYLTGIPISQHRAKKIDISFEAVKIGIKINREKLYGQINDRVEAMLKAGLIGEISALRDKNFHYSKYNSLNTVGIKEVFDYFDGKISYASMIELIKQNTRRFAKRQITWFKRYKDIKLIDLNNEKESLINYSTILIP